MSLKSVYLVFEVNNFIRKFIPRLAIDTTDIRGQKQDVFRASFHASLYLP